MCSEVQVSLDLPGQESARLGQTYESKSRGGEMMGVVYTYTEARQNFASLLDLAVREGEVRVRRKDGQTFVIKAEQQAGSPLDVEGVDLGITTTEIVQFIRESRRVS
jgi:PAS domain-containing protein